MVILSGIYRWNGIERTQLGHLMYHVDADVRQCVGDYRWNAIAEGNLNTALFMTSFHSPPLAKKCLAMGAGSLNRH